MADPENHTLALLRELRAAMQATEERLSSQIAASEARMTERTERIEKRLDAMHLNGVKALKGFIGHRSMTERAMGSVDDQFARREACVDALEARG